jgi:hypothetical protein
MLTDGSNFNPFGISKVIKSTAPSGTISRIGFESYRKSASLVQLSILRKSSAPSESLQSASIKFRVE